MLGLRLQRAKDCSWDCKEGAHWRFSVKGSIGLETARLGGPVIVMGDSPITSFPSVSPIGKFAELPGLVRRKLGERPPARQQVLDAYCKFLSPFAPAGYNDWTIRRDDSEILGYANLFAALARLLRTSGTESIGTISSR